MDALPFDVDKKKADLILETIFRMILEGVVRDGFTRIWGFGKFVKKLHKPHRYRRNLVHDRKYQALGISKPRYSVGFGMHKKTRVNLGLYHDES